MLLLIYLITTKVVKWSKFNSPSGARIWLEFLQIRGNFLSAVIFFRRYFTNDLVVLRTNQSFFAGWTRLVKRQTKSEVDEGNGTEKLIWYICEIDMLIFYSNKDNTSVDEQCIILDDDVCKQIFKNNHKKKCIHYNKLLNINLDCMVIIERM